jgi:hypothetical protein
MNMKALLDSGVIKLPVTLLSDFILVYNIVGTQNIARSITYCAEIII